MQLPGETLVDRLRQRAAAQPEKRVYTFVREEGIEADSLNYKQLDQQAQAIASQLQSLGEIGDRALLLYPPGLDFIAAFFGCLYAGVVAVPGCPPKANQSLSRIKAIATDANPRFVLTTKSLSTHHERWRSQLPELAALPWLETDAIAPEGRQQWQPPVLNPQSLALLQYTSGSTGTPKGAMVTHANLLINCEDLDRGWKHDPDSIIVSWLPTFHDLGLIYGVIEPLYKGCSAYLMSPMSFLLRPSRWLQVISQYQATHSAAPNFAYDLCVRKIKPQERSRLNLTTWRMALNGAEPVRASVLKEFAQTFAPCGFDLSAFCPGYGLAEATLKVAAVPQKDPPHFYAVDSEALKQNQVKPPQADRPVQTLVGCGRSEIDTQIRIVDPQTLRQCPPDAIGEIWVSGATVVRGYWNNPAATAETFQAYLADTAEGPFLRTGDLGFLHDRQLFVTGRLKETILIQGRNHYPQDIELTVANCHPALVSGGVAAFSVDKDGEERLVVVSEIQRHHRRSLNPADVLTQIRQTVAAEHDLRVQAIALIKPGTLPKTSSGKIQRRACRQQFCQNQLVRIED
ncbi:MAG: fatty acyl-AMP ligase [Oscillatoria sp. PMC 1051.18]|nr:fatty acyl-AMP ligase [Oscillatoria sp. PMC 1050.18]MEC5033180.1 fatty acyl-AMP ligase [Oscillatoria sp. PMC 1051.18]